MTIHSLSRLPKSLNRREVMIGAAGLSFGVASGLVSPCDVEFSTTANAADSATLNPWVTISADGTISIMSPASEMGQGSKTSLPLIVAEEMDAAWDKVRIVAAPPSDAIYGNPGCIDPVAFRLSILKDSPRARKVVETVADLAQWGRKRNERGLGLAYIDYSGTQIAGVAEISVDGKSGQIRVHDFWVAIDPGIAVQPDNIVAQVEGSVIYGMGLSLTEQVTVRDGEIQESNFYDYRVMRMSDTPEIHVKVLSTDNKPTGAGQMATPLVAPAISNAVADLLGVRLNHTPMLPERVLATLK
jgi:CO/xanthine dehydrogenase Mo-binding subunit